MSAYHQKNKFILFFIVCLAKTLNVYGQQDCITAIPICQSVYYEAVSYAGVGTIDELTGGFNTSCLNGGEDNSVWYIFTVSDPGSFEFEITPNAINDDYDWTIYDLTNADCSDILNGTAPEPRCNYSAIPGATGLSNPYTQTSVPQGGPNQCAPMTVNVGETYVLMVNNFAGSTNGYTLNLGGTAVIYDTVPPTVTGLDPFTCQYPDVLHITFSEPVSCSSIAADGTDFHIYGPSPVPIVSATSVNCLVGLFTTDVFINLAGPINVNGHYVLRFQLGSNGNILLDNCQNEMSYLDSLPFDVAIADAEFTYLIGKTCFGDSVVFNNSSVGNILNSTTWNFGDGTTSTDFNPSHNYPSTGSYWVTLLVTDTAGCSDKDSVLINTYVEDPVAGFSVSAEPYCTNVPVSFFNSSTGQGLTYSWQFGLGSTDEEEPEFSFVSSGLFTVVLTVTDSIGCEDSVSANLLINPGVVADFNHFPEKLCTADTIEFSNVSAGNPTAVSWDFGNGITDTSSTTVNVVYNTSGTYTVTLIVEDAICFPDTFTENITVSDYPVVDLGADTSICIGESFTLNAGFPEYTHNWSTGETTQSIVVSLVPQIVVLFVDNNGCIGKDSILIDAACPFYIPTAFTPNGDGINDEYKIITDGTTDFRLSIFNRWGQLVYTTTDPGEGWNGTYQAIPEEMGVYVYQLQIIFMNGASRIRHGNITLIR